METLCPSVQSNGEAASYQLTVGGILRLFLPVLLHLLKLSAHKLRVLWQLAACGTPALGSNLFHCPHCQHRHWAPRSCGNRHCPRCLAAKSWQWLEKQPRSLLPITYYHCVFTQTRSWNHCRVTYLGTEARLPSSSSLHCHRWSITSGWQRVALAQTAQVP